MPASTCDYHLKKAGIAAGLVDCQGRAKYTPRSLRGFFASKALANGVPIHEVSRWLGHRSTEVTVDIYGHLVLRAWHRCREVLQNAMRPGSLDMVGQPVRGGNAAGYAGSVYKRSSTVPPGSHFHRSATWWSSYTAACCLLPAAGQRRHGRAMCRAGRDHKAGAGRGQSGPGPQCRTFASVHL
jgi:hypothetical protein